VFVTGGTGAGAGGGTVVSRAFDVSRQVVQVTPDGLGGWVAGPPFLTGAQLITGRWGHASVELPNDRVLVTGGLAPVADDANQIQAIDRAEVVVYGRAAMWNPCPASLIDGGVAELPTGVDAGPPDPDAGDPDGGVAAMDAGF
jgi:hypothetical protein